MIGWVLCWNGKCTPYAIELVICSHKAPRQSKLQMVTTSQSPRFVALRWADLRRERINEA